jgi:exonuclease SbcC
MLLKRLRLKNIRTYEDWEVAFPKGSILFEGGIGSGKSTLLLAMEFALFGLGNEKGTTLLSLGKNVGEVELDFEAMGLDVRVHRALVRSRRGASVNQGVLVPGGVKQEDCWMEYGGSRISYSPKEMKEAVLKVLGYNEPMDPKAKSIIFRYAVYTPQEEMKEILSQPPDQRLQTIRKALRLEEYKTAKDNAHNLARMLSIRSKILGEETKKLPEIEAEVARIQGNIPKVKGELESIKDEVTDAEMALRGHRSTREELQSRLEGLAGEARKEAELSRALQDDLRRVSALHQGISSGSERARALRKRLDETHLPTKPQRSAQEATRMLNEAKMDLARCTEGLGRANQLYKSYSQLIDRRVCPTCNQPVDPDEFRARLEEMRLGREDFVREKERAQVRVDGLEEERQLALSYENSIRAITEMEDNIYNTENQVAKDEDELRRAEASKLDLEGRIRESTKAASLYKDVKCEYDSNEVEIVSLEKSLEELRRRRSMREADLIHLQDSLQNQEAKKKEIIEKESRSMALGEYVTWLEEYFAVALDRIEISILTAANIELNEELGRWFSFLVEDPTKSVRIDEDFTPLVTQDAYEQEVSNLSGGERTALALAYRLALNRIVQRRAGIDSGLLILDEPTDGFSKDQIGKIGDLLSELCVQQAIIVSHERELEGAVDHIFRVEKKGGRSAVMAVSA